MNVNNKNLLSGRNIKSLLIVSLILIPAICLAQSTGKKNINLYEQILSVVDFVLIITSLISIKQFFWPGDENRTPFQIFNMVFCLVFYIVSLTFLVHNKEYYVGFEQLSPLGCIKKIFFDKDDITSTIKQWIPIFGFIINICYIVRNGKDEYYAQS